MSAGAAAPRFDGRSGVLDGIATGAVLGIAALCVLRTVVAYGPVKWFDVDPAFDSTLAAAWGPAQALVADALTLSLAALVFAVCACRMRLADAVVALAVLVPAGTAAWHGALNADDAWRGAGWVASMVGAAAMWTGVRGLNRGVALRTIALAVLAAAAGPLLVHAAVQLFWEHSATLADFQRFKAAAFASRGWTADSPEALSYVRRLEQWEATGWFGLSNILSSLLAALALAYAGCALAGRRTLERGSLLVLGIVAAGCLIVVGINGSKGALGALVLGAAVAFVAGRQRERSRAASLAALACIMLVVAAVAVRGLAGESFAERSLLFRWQYMMGAWCAWIQHPFLGTGAAGFAQSYLSTRPDRAPEEVLSAHSMWVDWITTFGVFATLWIAVMVVWVWKAGSTAGAPRAGVQVGRSLLIGGVCAVVGASALGISAELHVLDTWAFAGRVMGAALAAVLAVAVVQAIETKSHAAAAGLIGAVAVLVVHAQIEMTAWQPGSAAWLIGFVALVAAERGLALRSVGWVAPVGVLASVGALACACLVVVYGAIPAAREEAQAERAASIIIAAASPGPIGALRAVPPEIRAQAARSLADPQGLPEPWANHASRLAQSLDQYAQALAATRPGTAEHASLSAESLAAARELVARAPTDAVLGASMAVARQVSSGVAAAGGDPTVALQAQLDYARGQIKLNPRNTRALLRAGEALQSLGRRAEAANAYRRALEVDETFALDPLRQLPDAERSQIAARVAALGRE